jgi:hypothetical protein
MTDDMSDEELERMTKDIVWGAEAIAKIIKREPRATYYLLERGHIPTAKKVGGNWVASRRAILKFLLEDPSEAKAS